MNKYYGKFSGYVAHVKDIAKDIEYEIQTLEGVTGMNCSCVVTENNGKWSITVCGWPYTVTAVFKITKHKDLVFQS